MDNAAAKQLVFEEYDQLIEDARTMKPKMWTKRYENMLPLACWPIVPLIPTIQMEPSRSCTIPTFAWTGHKGQSFNYKYLEVQDKVVSAEDYDKAWINGRKKKKIQ